MNKHFPLFEVEETERGVRTTRCRHLQYDTTSAGSQTEYMRFISLTRPETLMTQWTRQMTSSTALPQSRPYKNDSPALKQQTCRFC